MISEGSGVPEPLRSSWHIHKSFPVPRVCREVRPIGSLVNLSPVARFRSIVRRGEEWEITYAFDWRPCNIDGSASFYVRRVQEGSEDVLRDRSDATGDAA